MAFAGVHVPAPPSCRNTGVNASTFRTSQILVDFCVPQVQVVQSLEANKDASGEDHLAALAESEVEFLETGHLFQTVLELADVLRFVADLQVHQIRQPPKRQPHRRPGHAQTGQLGQRRESWRGELRSPGADAVDMRARQTLQRRQVRDRLKNRRDGARLQIEVQMRQLAHALEDRQKIRRTVENGVVEVRVHAQLLEFGEGRQADHVVEQVLVRRKGKRQRRQRVPILEDKLRRQIQAGERSTRGCHLKSLPGAGVTPSLDVDVEMGDVRQGRQRDLLVGFQADAQMQSEFLEPL